MTTAIPFTARSTAAEVLAGIDLTGRRMIVTGGASGIGEQTVRALAGAGAEIVVATRNPGSAAELTAEFTNVSAATLDLADLRSVRAFVAGWHGHLDALIANAGIMAVRERTLSVQGWELQLATNYLGHFALIDGLHAALTPGGRVVVVSSGAHKFAGFDFDDPQFEHRAYDPFLAYGQAKRAEVLLAVGVARRWAADGITANAVAPGFVHTNLQRHLDADTMRSFGAMDDAGELVTPDYYKTAAQGASTSVLLAASPLIEGLTGRYFEDNQEAPVVADEDQQPGSVAASALDPEIADRLWELALPMLSTKDVTS
ncbi:SDR family NAD(P)-dependent oxidoreductase [Winogradskya humida]|uniref:Oxidoreductase n=1 Tax=Winogradskya humida TaxID=113566 RepID=A0ABQ3ZJX9_9ACTN|nr:SDR family NAD(P)-dependent oxidoreductase [Actinoplanes humidus]GIE18901.1 oxidoreductase [Actinoplanes humidus]